MKTWLDKGRPFSLIALETMVHCAKGNRPVLVEQYSPKILHTDKSEVVNTLDDYLQKDGSKRQNDRVYHIEQ
ncbi:hypothetical protein [Bacillus pumilus]|uniref:hypothetical protein n=1 Tax=Bacillus pumilus TaxID=1408 RepID=UPI0034D78360